MADLRSTYMGLELAHPVVASASPLSRSLDGIRRLEDGGAAAIVMFSLFEEQIREENAAIEHLVGVGAESFAESLNIEDRRYDYLVYAAPQPSVIIIAFHGFTGDGAVMAEQTKLHERGAAAVVAYPSGWWSTWDGTPDSIDVHMAAELIGILQQEYGQLPVCVTGISAGATMAWRVAAELPVNAMVAVAGPLNPVSGSPPARPRVLEVQGDADTTVPLEGGPGLFGDIPPAQAGIDLFSAAGSQAELRVIPGGQHYWDMGVGYDTTGEVLNFCGA